RARILVERPAFGAMVAGRLRAVHWALALPAVELADVAAGERDPIHAILIDVAAARAEARHRDVEVLGQRGLGRIRAGHDAHDRTRIGADGTPDRVVDGAHRDRVDHLAEAAILGRIHRLVGLGIRSALAVAVGVEDERGPAHRLR